MKLNFFLAIFITTTCQFANASYAAIAYSPSTGAWGNSWGFDNQQGAQERALSNCQMNDCQLVVWTKNGFAALVAGDNGLYGWAWGDNKATVLQGSTESCQKVTGNCSLKTWVYSFDTNVENLEFEKAMSPHDVKLREIGGAFDFQIPNFMGFTQQQDKWCWAAATEAIHYALTGTLIQQTELARIHTNELNTKSRDSIKNLDWVDKKSCEGDQANSPRCNHTGNTGTALSYLKEFLPKKEYPRDDDPASLYRALRASLTNGVPAGIRIVWSDGGAHTIIVYGATFSLSRETKGLAEISLKVFDPWDSRTYVMHSNEYKPAYRQSSGIWDSHIFLGNFENVRKTNMSSESMVVLLK